MYLSGLAYVAKVPRWDARIGILANWLFNILILFKLAATL